MATIALRFVVFATRAAVQVHKTVVVSSGDDGLVLAHLHDVDVTSIGAGWVDAIHEPAKLHSVVSPRRRCGCRCATTHVLHDGSLAGTPVVGVEEEKLVRTTGRPNPITIERPVKSSDVAAMPSALAFKHIVAIRGGRIDPDEVVVGADSQLGSLVVVAHDFDPLLGLVQLLDDLVQAEHSLAIRLLKSLDLAD